MTNGSLIFQMCGTKVVEVNASDLAVVGLVKNAAGTADLSSILGIRYMGGTFWAFGNGGFKSLGPDKTVPAITLAADKSSLVYGDSQDLTATVTDSSGAFLPTGTVTWTKVSGPSSQTLCADTPLNGSGVATCHLDVPLAGSYTLTARYNGDTSLAAVTSTSSSFTVTKATPSIVVDDVAQNFTAYTMPTDGVVFTAHVTGAVGAVQPGGYVGWTINGPGGTSIYECTSEVALTNNEATCTLTGSSPWTVGFYQVTAYYMGTSGSDPNYVTGGPPDWGSIKVENEGTTSAFTVSPNSVTLGSRPTLNGELSYTSGAGPTGTVNYTITFPDGSQQVGCTLTLSGSASSPIGTPCEAPAFNMAGNYTIRMEYYGDSNYSSSFDSQTLVVSPYALTLGAPTADPTSAVASGVTTITFTAPALTAPSGALDPSGVITWTISGTAGAQSCLSEANVVGSPLTCTVDVSNAGTVTATYTYGGDQNYASGTSTSGSMTIQSPPAPTGSGSGSCALHSSVFFATNSAQLNADNILSVASVAEQIVNCHLTRILVTGYTDGWGSRSTNAALSAARATTVASLLKKDLKGFGVRDVTVTARGMGIATGSMSDSLKRHAIIGRL
jgi:outer membrane protein OmpA-like peptidoglycan-associated protein